MFNFINVEFLVTIQTQSRFNPNEIDKKSYLQSFTQKKK